MLSKIKSFFKQQAIELKESIKIYRQDDLIETINSFIIADRLDHNENLSWSRISNIYDHYQDTEYELAKVTCSDRGEYHFEYATYFYQAGLQIVVKDYKRYRYDGFNKYTQIVIAIRRHVRDKLTPYFIDIVEAQFNKKIDLNSYGEDVYAEYIAQVDGNYKEMIDLFNILMAEIENLRQR